MLLFCDGHSIHTKNLQLIEFGKDNGIDLLCLPPHSSHKLQTLNAAFMKPLSTYYENEVRLWLQCYPGKVIKLWQVLKLFGFAYVNATTMKTAMKSF